MSPETSGLVSSESDWSGRIETSCLIVSTIYLSFPR